MIKIKKIVNALIAICIANLPSIFPDSRVILGVYIIGLIAIFSVIYLLLNKINK